MALGVAGVPGGTVTITVPICVHQQWETSIKMSFRNNGDRIEPIKYENGIK